mgnify:CR=1 FL=1
MFELPTELVTLVALRARDRRKRRELVGALRTQVEDHPVVGPVAITALIQQQSLMDKLPYDPAKDFAPVSGLAGGTMGTLFGIGAPPYAMYLTRRIDDKTSMRATLSTMVLFSTGIRLIVFTVAGLIGRMPEDDETSDADAPKADAGDDTGAGEYANMAKYAAGEVACNATDVAVHTHGGNGLAQEYGLGMMLLAARLGRIAPVSREMILNYVAMHSLGLPKSY